MTSDIILQFQGITKKVKSGTSQISILNDVSFELRRGETCAVVGPSGSGKTTLLTIAAGLDRATGGTVLFRGQDLSALSEDQLSSLRGLSIGFIFQNYQLISSLNVLENVLLPLEIRGQEGEVKARALLERVGLKNRWHHYPSQLSGGEQQRVAIVRAFINSPAILFADEPTGSLDNESAEAAIEAMFELNKSTECSILLVTHDMELADRLNRKIILKNGSLVANV